MKFVASFSGGKDCILAIHRAIKDGHEPVALLTTYNEEQCASWFHQLSLALLEKSAESMGISLIVVNTKGENYERDFENSLIALKKKGVDMCVFGDIDILDHYNWCNTRCINSGLKSYFPLWNENRKELVTEFISYGYKSIITVINTNMMSEKYLGEILTYGLLDEFEKEGIDVCGENGEYHTYTFDGGLFHEKINFTKGNTYNEKNKVFLKLDLEED